MAIRDGQGEIALTDEPSIEFAYMLPPGMPAIVQRNFDGELSVVDLPTADGPERRVIVREGESLMMLYTSRRSARPLSVEAMRGLRLNQRAVSVEKRPSFLVVPVEAVTGTTVRVIPTRQAVTLSANAGNFVAWIETSHFYAASPALQRGPGTYVLETWIVPAGK